MESETMEAVTILIPTYNRPEVLLGTVQRLYHHFKYSGPWSILVSDDSEEWVKAKECMDVAREILPGINLDYLRGPQQGLGANLNHLLLASETEIVFQMDDDHYLEHGVDMDEYVYELATDSAFGWIRLFQGEKKDSDKKHSYYKFWGKMYGRYWRLIPNAGELYITSNRPHLKTKEFHRRYGAYHEGGKLGECESEFCHRFADMWVNDGTLDVFIPMYPPPLTAWRHVGDSWQKKGL